jgi:hypothetical protein
MRIRYLLYNDPSELLKAKEREGGTGFNYAWSIHDGHAEIKPKNGDYLTFPIKTGVKISFSKKGKVKRGDTTQQWVRVKSVPAKAGIKYFDRAVKAYRNDFDRAIKEGLDITIKDNNFSLVVDKLVQKLTDVAERMKNEAINIVGSEAKDTGDLQASIKVTKVEVI